MAVLPDRIRRNPNHDLEELKDKAQRARTPYDKDILLNLAFFLDQQYVEWVADADSIRSIPRKEGFKNTPRPVSNKIMHFVVQQHSMTLQNKPSVDVLPASDDPVDTSVASVSLAYLRWVSEPQVADFDGEISEAVWWALAGGEAYLKWTFNADAKRPDVMAVSPLEILIDPYAKRFKHARYIIHTQFMDVEQVKEMYGVDVQPASISKADQAKTALLHEMGQAPILEGAVVNELWYKPCKKYPKGLYTVWAGKDVLVARQDFPYAHKRLPFTQIGSIPRPNAPHYTCASKYLRSPQMELNKYHAQRLMVREAFSNPKWWIPEELELEAPPDDSPRQILRGNSNGGQLEPKVLQPTDFPENSDGDWITREMMDVVGLHEISQGGVPGRVEAAKAIELLKESDDSHLAELHNTIKLAISEGYWQMLMLAKQYVSEEQIVQTYSREGMPEVKRFKSEKVKPGMRVQVTMQTGLARSRAARQDQAMLMWDKGIIRDPEVMSEMMDLPVGTLTPQRVFDIRLARNENLVMVEGDGKGEGGKGTAITPNSWDEHEIHLREHNNFRKTAEYEQLVPDVKRKFEFHCKSHEQLEMEKLQHEAQKQALFQQVMQPQPGADPNAPQPQDPAGPNQTPNETAGAAA